MASKFIQGKVLVVIRDHLSVCPYIHVFTQSAVGGLYAWECLDEDVHCHLSLHLRDALTKRQMGLPEGTVFRIRMTVEIHYTTDYWGEHDSSMEVLSRSTRRVQIPTRKADKLWQQQLKTRQRRALTNPRK